MARNDQDGRGRRTSFNNDEADNFRDRAASIERTYQRQVRQGLLRLANAALAKRTRLRDARGAAGAARASAGASGLQAFGARRRSAQSALSAANRHAEAAHQLDVTATRQEMAADRAERDAAHRVNLRDLLSGRYA